MLYSPRVDPAAFADLIAGYCLEVKPGQQISVRSSTEAAPLLLEVQRAILERDAWPILHIDLPGQTRGFYDHALPPLIDENGYGLRVPGLVISPYARRGYIDSQVLTFDAYLKLIEDRFLGGQRLDPATDGRPDSRPTVREEMAILGDLALSFDFDQKPRKPLILDPTP